MPGPSSKKEYSDKSQSLCFFVDATKPFDVDLLLRLKKQLIKTKGFYEEKGIEYRIRIAAFGEHAPELKDLFPDERVAMFHAEPEEARYLALEKANEFFKLKEQSKANCRPIAIMLFEYGDADRERLVKIRKAVESDGVISCIHSGLSTERRELDCGEPLYFHGGEGLYHMLMIMSFGSLKVPNVESTADSEEEEIDFDEDLITPDELPHPIVPYLVFADLEGDPRAVNAINEIIGGIPSQGYRTIINEQDEPVDIRFALFSSKKVGPIATLKPAQECDWRDLSLAGDGDPKEALKSMVQYWYDYVARHPQKNPYCDPALRRARFVILSSRGTLSQFSDEEIKTLFKEDDRNFKGVSVFDYVPGSYENVTWPLTKAELFNEVFEKMYFGELIDKYYFQPRDAFSGGWDDW